MPNVCFDCDNYRKGRPLNAPKGEYYCNVDLHEIKKPKREICKFKPSRFIPTHPEKYRKVRRRTGLIYVKK